MLEARLGRVEVAQSEVDLAAKRLGPGDEGSHAARLRVGESAVEDVHGILDLPTHEVVAAEQGQRLSQRLAGVEPRGALDA